MDGIDGPIRVLPKQVHVNSVTDRIENVTFLKCDPAALVKVRVPIEIVGEESNPDLKKGGFLNVLRRAVPTVCR